MTTPNPAAAPAPPGEVPGNSQLAPEPGTESPHVPGLICQADTVEIGVADDAKDPFNATFLLAGTHEGRELAVWFRLTPTTITNLTTQLHELLLAQQQSLGITGDQPVHEPPDADQEHPDSGEGRIKRLFDPLGIRHLKERSTSSTVFLAAAIASLVILAFIVQLIRG